MTTYAPRRLERRPPPRPPAKRAPARPKTVKRAPTRVDPRLHARRAAVVRSEGRRRLHRLLFVVGLLAVAAIAAGLVYSPILDVNRVAVTGATGEQAAAIRTAAAVDRGEPLLLVDLSKVRAGVETLPFVAEASIVRELPGTLRVEVTWREPVAWLPNAAGGVDLVDALGSTVISADAPPAGVPQLVTTTGPTKRAAAIAAALTVSLRSRTVGVSLDGDHAELALAGGIVVRLGSPLDLRAKVRAAEAVLDALGGRTVTYIDVRVPGAPVTG